MISPNWYDSRLINDHQKMWEVILKDTDSARSTYQNPLYRRFSSESGGGIAGTPLLK